jgi:hypothetical protein
MDILGASADDGHHGHQTKGTGEHNEHGQHQDAACLGTPGSDSCRMY